jgi:hypothetical protein
MTKFRRLKLMTGILAGATLGSLILGACSVQPFTRLLRPWIRYSQWKRVAYPSPDDPLCVAELARRGADSGPYHLKEAGCAVETQVIVHSLGAPLTNIALGPTDEDTPIMSCQFALRLQSFVANVLQPAARDTFHQHVVEILHKGAYACRGQRSQSGLMSDHAFGEAFDFAGVRLNNGREVTIEKDFGSSTDAGNYLRTIAERACAEFGTTLGPAFDDRHRDHLHFSSGFPRVCKY